MESALLDRSMGLRRADRRSLRSAAQGLASRDGGCICQFVLRVGAVKDAVAARSCSPDGVCGCRNFFLSIGASAL